MKISNLINREAKWTKDCLARDKQGRVLRSLDCFYLAKFDKDGKIYYQEFKQDELAYSYSLQGAVTKCYSIDDHENVMSKLSAAILKHTGKNIYVARFNDDQDTKFEDVKAVLKIANV